MHALKKKKNARKKGEKDGKDVVLKEGSGRRNKASGSQEAAVCLFAQDRE